MLLSLLSLCLGAFDITVLCPGTVQEDNTTSWTVTEISLEYDEYYAYWYPEDYIPEALVGNLSLAVCALCGLPLLEVVDVSGSDEMFSMPTCLSRGETLAARSPRRPGSGPRRARTTLRRGPRARRAMESCRSPERTAGEGG